MHALILNTFIRQTQLSLRRRASNYTGVQFLLDLKSKRLVTSLSVNDHSGYTFSRNWSFTIVSEFPRITSESIITYVNVNFQELQGILYFLTVTVFFCHNFLALIHSKGSAYFWKLSSIATLTDFPYNLQNWLIIKGALATGDDDSKENVTKQMSKTMAMCVCCTFLCRPLQKNNVKWSFAQPCEGERRQLIFSISVRN